MHNRLVAFILLIIILGCASIITYNSKIEKLTENTTSLGNCIAIYFINMAKAFQEGKDFSTEVNVVNEITKHLPANVPCDKEAHEKLAKLAPIQSDIGLWVCVNDDIANMWMIMKPIAQKILDDVIVKINKKPERNIPIIHFRCSDVPFLRSNHYKMSKHSFYTDCVNELKMSGINCEKIQIMYSNIHNKVEDNAKSCDAYVEHIKIHVLKNGVNDILVESSTEIQDFINLFYAPAVISIGSSFSFIAGFLGKGVFLSSGHIDGEENKCTVCKWLKRGYSVQHEQIPDYHNIPEVMKILE